MTAVRQGNAQAGEGLRCRCGRPYSKGPDLVVPDDVWAKISPTGDEGGVLCPNCIHDALVAAGFGDGSVSAAFTSGPMADPSWRKDAPAPATPEGLREKVARIIDPVGWETWDRQSREIDRIGLKGEDRNKAILSARFYVNKSLSKADAILAALRPDADGGA